MPSGASTCDFALPERLHEVDGHTLSSESATAANAMNVELAIVGQVVADDQRHLATAVDHLIYNIKSNYIQFISPLFQGQASAV